MDGRTALPDLTLEEKASLCSGADNWRTKAVDRLGVPAVLVSDGPHGLRKQTGGGEQLGIGESVPATCFPTAAALASSWDRDLLHRVGAAIGAEAREQQVAVVLGPGVNIKRTPLCGRNFEYFSEDPVLTGELGAALVAGIQSQGVGTSVKHFAANNQETDRMRVSAEVDERTLREIYLTGFERVVRGSRPWTVMCSYNRVNGVYASQNHWLLTEVLREEWGFDGLVVSDWGAVADRVAALEAGLDLEMPSSGGRTDAEIVAAVRAGALDEAVLDRAVERILTLVDRSRPVMSGSTEDASGPVSVDDHHALAREAAARCAVLLKNDGDLLPLEPGEGPVAVLGELARTPRYQGAGSSQVNPTRLDDALGYLSRDCEVRFAPGYRLDGEDDATLQKEAVDVAGRARTVVCFLGLPTSYESEGFDRQHIDLPANQVAMLEAVAEVNDRVVVVLSNGGVVRVSSWEHHAGALLEGWLLGQAGGSALADLLLGRTAPTGRLAETVPVRLEDCAAHLGFPGELGQVRYGEGQFVGYRQYDAQRLEVSYPFGHGLTYTTFEYSRLMTEVVGDAPEPGAAELSTDEVVVRVRCTVTNTGSRPGTEVVQLYVGDPEASLTRPVRELKAFTTVTLDAGESREVSLELSQRDLGYFHPRLGWVLEAGRFDLAVGASSRDLRLHGTVEVTGPELVMPLGRDSSVDEWARHPVGGPMLREALGEEGAAAVLDGEFFDLVGSMPLSRLAAFPGMSMDPDAYEVLVARVTDAGAWAA